MSTEIFIKGRRPHKSYSISFKEIFNRYANQVFQLSDIMRLLDKEGIRTKINIKTIRGILDYRNKANIGNSKDEFFLFAGPFKMEKVLDSHFLYNLDYQDAVVKVEIEKAEEKSGVTHSESERNSFALEIFKFISIILRTDFLSDGQPLYVSITNLELDYIILKCLTFFNLDVVVSNRELINIGNRANEISYKTQEEIFFVKTPSLKEILIFNIFSGVIWWSDIEIQNKYSASPTETVKKLKAELSKSLIRELSVDDFHNFTTEVLNTNKSKKIIYFLDDNGELVWDLFFIQKIIEANKHINIVCAIHDKPISNTANYNTLSYLLEKAPNHFLRNLSNENRFKILRENNNIPAFDPRFMSSKLAQELYDSDIVISKGMSNFEKLQFVPIPTYYLFTVYSKLSTILTGFKRFSGIFARADPRSYCFKNIQSYNGKITVEMNLNKFHRSYHSS
jgi:hypothetical protein